MEKIYSKIEPEKLLHCIIRLSDVENQDNFRKDLIAENNFIQCSSLKMMKGHSFKPHKHIWKLQNLQAIAQESWIVIKGSVECSFFDLDNSLLEKPILYPGDASFTLEGGHTYFILEDNTIVYEMKTGPYFGQKMDKIFIE